MALPELDTATARDKFATRIDKHWRKWISSDATEDDDPYDASYARTALTEEELNDGLARIRSSSP